jgi:hypothetical protein
MREILLYLIEHPDAKDTAAGIRQWWLATNQGERGSDVVKAVLDLLVARGWLTVRRTISFKRLYGLNQARMEEIRTFLNI